MAPCTEFSYNDKIQSATGFSPFFVNYGQHPYKGTNTRKRSQKARALLNFLKKCRKYGRKTESALRLAAEQMKTYYDRKTRIISRLQTWRQRFGSKVRISQPTDHRRNSTTSDMDLSRSLRRSAKLHTNSNYLKPWRSIWPVFNEIFLTPSLPNHLPFTTETRTTSSRDRGWTKEYESKTLWTLNWFEDAYDTLSNGRLSRTSRMDLGTAQHLTHADEAINDFHKFTSSAPRKVPYGTLQFKPIPPHKKQIPPHLPHYLRGIRKINVDDWTPQHQHNP